MRSLSWRRELVVVRNALAISFTRFSASSGFSLVLEILIERLLVSTTTSISSAKSSGLTSAPIAAAARTGIWPRVTFRLSCCTCPATAALGLDTTTCSALYFWMTSLGASCADTAPAKMPIARDTARMGQRRRSMALIFVLITWSLSGYGPYSDGSFQGLCRAIRHKANR